MQKLYPAYGHPNSGNKSRMKIYIHRMDIRRERTVNHYSKSGVLKFIQHTVTQQVLVAARGIK